MAFTEGDEPERVEEITMHDSAETGTLLYRVKWLGYVSLEKVIAIEK